LLLNPFALIAHSNLVARRGHNGIDPLLDLAMRLGEASGAALAIKIAAG
jgi:NaMN:DMB phosphoribosyltransferase